MDRISADPIHALQVPHENGPQIAS
jgi:hypothetical protein